MESPPRLRAPWTELAIFVRAALVAAVPRDHTEPPAVRRRRQWVSAATLVVGGSALAVTLRIPPGSPAFYWAGFGLAAIWGGGALLAGPLHLGHAHTRRGDRYARPIVQSVALGVLLLAIFLAGAAVVAGIPLLRRPVDGLLDHARLGSLGLVLLVTAVNGFVEELYFRGALYAALPSAHAVAASTALYTLTTVGSGVPLLVFAAAVLGTVTALQRRVTGGILGPVITHLTWSVGMLLGLPLILRS